MLCFDLGGLSWSIPHFCKSCPDGAKNQGVTFRNVFKKGLYCGKSSILNTYEKKSLLLFLYLPGVDVLSKGKFQSGSFTNQQHSRQFNVG